MTAYRAVVRLRHRDQVHLMATTDHPSFPQPQDDNISVWRYMDLGKFLSLIQKNSLYFRRIDAFEDKYEGLYTEVAHKWANASDGELELGAIDAVEREQISANRQAYAALLRGMRTYRSKTFVNCWHMNDEESQAMWRLYTAQNEALAIRSSYKNLAELLPKQILIGMVSYADYKNYAISVSNLYNIFMHKRKSFEHEKEIRAVTIPEFDTDTPMKMAGEYGALIDVDVNKLIEEVYVSPNSSSDFRDIVVDLLRVYQIEAPVLQSGVNAPPPY